MFEFKKNKSSDKVLTEKEIQQKLYGRFLNSKNTAAGAAETYLRPSGRSAAALFPEETVEEQPQIRPSDLVSEPRPAEKKPVPKDALREKFQTSESELLRTVQKPKLAKPVFQPVLPKIKLPALPWKTLLSGIAGGLTAVFRTAFSGIFALGRVVDFRREGVRTGLAWGSGIVVLVLLLAAIHGLNSKREYAMKTAPQTPKKTAVKIAPAKKTVPVIPAAAEIEIQNAEPTADSALSAAETKPTLQKEAAADVSKGRFVIQVATYVIRDDANRLAEDLKKTQTRGFVKGLSRASGKTYYSVFLGRFENYQAAQDALAKFKKTDLSRSFKDAFMRTLDS